MCDLDLKRASKLKLVRIRQRVLGVCETCLPNVRSLQKVDDEQDKHPYYKGEKAPPQGRARFIPSGAPLTRVAGPAPRKRRR
jgi:hypothetical protein